MLTGNDMKHLNPNKGIAISVYLRITLYSIVTIRFCLQCIVLLLGLLVFT